MRPPEDRSASASRREPVRVDEVAGGAQNLIEGFRSSGAKGVYRMSPQQISAVTEPSARFGDLHIWTLHFEIMGESA